MKKVNEKLVSTLATERLIADSAVKTRGEESPTSTNSSTSTLKGDESAENIPSLVQDQVGVSSTSSKKDNAPAKDDSAGGTKAENQAKKEPLTKKDSPDAAPVSSGHSHSFEGPTVITRSYGRYDSATLDRRSKTPLTATISDGPTKKEDYLTRSFTLDRRRDLNRNGSKSVDRDPTSTSKSLSTTPTGRTGRGLSKQAAEDLLALDPKTIQSLEKLKKLTAGRKSPRPKTPDPPHSPSAVSADVKRLSPHVHRRPTTPEPQAPPVTDVKLLHSPERRRRRKSEGMHPIEKQAGKSFVPCEKALHEGDEHDQEPEMEKVKQKENSKEGEQEMKEKETVKESERENKVEKSAKKKEEKAIKGEPFEKQTAVKEEPTEKPKEVRKITIKSKEMKNDSSKPVATNEETPPAAEPAKPIVARADSKKSDDRSGEIKKSVKSEVLESKRSSSPVKEVRRSISSPKQDKPSDTEKKTATSSELTSSKLENGDHSLSPKKRISSSSSSEDSGSGSSRSISISSFTRSTPIDRIWSDFKKEDNGSANRVHTSPRSNRYRRSSQDSLNNINDSPSRRRFVMREQYLDDAKNNSSKVNPGSSSQDAEPSPRTSRSTSPTNNQPKEEVKSAPTSGTKPSAPTEEVKSPPTSATKTSAPMEFGTCYSVPRNKSPPGVSRNDSFKKNTPKSEEVKVAKPNETPAIVLRPPSVDESSKKDTSSLKPTRQTDIPVRQKSPVPDIMKQMKANRRKTPVISDDALAAILSGDIPEDDDIVHDGTCPISPSQKGDPRMTLETCLEEDEDLKQYFSSPTRSRKNFLQADSTTSPPERSVSPQRTPVEKRVVSINSEPCIRRVGKRRHMLSADMKERTKSLTSFSPERSLSPPSPRETDTIPEEGKFPNDVNLRNLPINRLRPSSMVLSRSTPDLSEILGPKKKDRKARRIERSNSKRRVKGDGYVTSTRPNSMYNPLQSSSTHTASRSSSRILSGTTISKIASAFSRKDKADRAAEKDSNCNYSNNKISKRW